jgi:hypothetical protein
MEFVTRPIRRRDAEPRRTGSNRRPPRGDPEIFAEPGRSDPLPMAEICGFSDGLTLAYEAPWQVFS